MSKYSSDPAWASVTPIPLDDGSNRFTQADRENAAGDDAVTTANVANEALPLATIAYSDSYAEATAYLRAVMAANEMSDRALALTEDVIRSNPAHYTVWHWLLRHFKLWDSPAELADIERMIDEDVMNNSAWNHRWIMRFAPRERFESGLPGVGIPGGVGGAGAGKMVVVDEEMVDGEVEYAKKKIVLAPENRSPWAYLRGVLKAADRSLADLKGFAERFVVKEVVEEGQGEFLAKSSHALEWLGDVYAEQAHDAEAKNSAVQMFTLLKDKYDPIRKNYWEYRIRSMDK
ncbi:CaaX farnesyltransferase alpha subunit [Trichophyton tonsurans CBS 112818]|uniref:Protein farnesyltransferase/geranylgeranyltransferase type-1 subunit alpha n=1 Tax=Trichophyton tonsurans (strain CBS 112818) TaxID=647933 RepID=F2RZC3_TRIT1|nr:CaaX farnesyltransferase alpha subunit [Trichophyton tonsurans CBS 112818]